MNTIQRNHIDSAKALQSLMRELGPLHPAFQHLAFAVALLMAQNEEKEGHL